MSEDTGPKLSFACQFDERTALEVEQKGFFEHALVEFPNGVRVPICFWDPARLAQDLETETRLGRVCIGEPGLIVLRKVTLKNMTAAVEELYRRGYFDRLKSLFS